MNLAIRFATLEDCPGLARVQVDSYRSTYGSILPAAYLAHFTYEEQEQDWRDWLDAGRGKGLIVAVTPDGEIAGYAYGEPGEIVGLPYQGELAALHVDAEHRGQGVGSALFQEVRCWLEDQGCHGLFCWVLAENPACGFYERLGGVRVGARPWENNRFFDVEIDEVAYGYGEVRP
jgi:GNAT superfamily N-acetyltransferase